MKYIPFFFVISLFVFSCQSRKEEELVSDQNQELVQAAANPIQRNLKSIKGKGILFGHQDDLAYGIDWKYLDGESDVRRVSGDYPALFGWELGGIERGDTNNLDSVPFDTMRKLALKAHELGGVNTFSWHPYDPIHGTSSWTRDVEIVPHILPGGKNHQDFVNQLDKLSKFMQSFKDDKGGQMPFIFRPWHEMDGTWFWWGSEQCTSEQFKKLFSFTIDYLIHEQGVQNMLVAYSPDRNFDSTEAYLTWYPGDEYVDILGMDNYHDLKQDQGHLEVIRKLHLVIQLANEKNKLSAFTETGLENVTDPTWFENELGAVLSDSLVKREISYVMIWRNDPDVHFYFPYPGHPAENSARRLLKRKELLLLNDFNKLK